MTTDRPLRLKAGHTLGRTLIDPDVRAALKAAGHRSGHEIVVVLDTDPIADVLARVRAYDPPVTIAVYATDTGQLSYATVSHHGAEHPQS